MKLCCAALLALASGASSQNVVQFNVTKGLPGIHVGAGPSLSRRATYSEELINHIAGGGYFAQVKVGTPGQVITMLLDTGSSDAWVLSHEADLCTDEDLQDLYGMTCADTYDPSQSSTSKMVKPDGFRILYLDGGTASGDYITDDFTIGGTTLKSLQMACVTQAVRGTGILGLGFSASERAAIKYPNIMDELANQGKIGCKAYSLYLNDRRTDTGTILFGGIDTDKFIGRLEVLPLHKPPGSGANYSSFEVNFASVTLTHTNGTTVTIPTSILDHPAPAVLDSGTTLSYLPDQMAAQIYSSVGAVFDPDLRMTLIDCAYLTADPSLRFTFSFSPTSRISVPVWEMVLDILSPSTTPFLDTHFPSSRPCVFGIQSTAIFQDTGTVKSSAGLNFTLLGDTFLRSAYVVYDLTHYQIGMAQANLNSTTETILELSSTGTSLPSAIGVAAQQTTFTPTSRRTVAIPSASGSENAAIGGKAGGEAVMKQVLVVVAVTGLFTLLGGALIAL